MPESKYAARLRALGCIPYSDLIPEKTLEEDFDAIQSLVDPYGGKVIKKMSRKERRALVAQGLLPNYHNQVPGSTYVTDEHGNDWTGPPGLDLHKELGFACLDPLPVEESETKMH